MRLNENKYVMHSLTCEAHILVSELNGERTGEHARGIGGDEKPPLIQLFVVFMWW